nr:hypothetical protein [Pseudobdellovibrionaceae bacterium]
MKIINKIIALGVSISPICMAQALEVDIDKGDVILAYSATASPYQIDYQIPERCKGMELKQVYTGSLLTLRHSGAPCPTG